MSFPKPPSLHELNLPVNETFTFQQYGTRDVTRHIWQGGSVSVWVDDLSNLVPSNRVNSFLRSYLGSPTAGTITRVSGLPAAIFTGHCYGPAGPCSGYIGNLAVLDGETLYFVGAFASDDTTVLDLLHTFRVAN
jgi:hypothetical protein